MPWYVQSLVSLPPVPPAASPVNGKVIVARLLSGSAFRHATALAIFSLMPAR